MSEKPKLGELLISAGAIDQAQLSAALGEQRRWGRKLGRTLVGMGILNEETLVRTLARQLRLPVAWLRGKRVSAEVLALVPVELAEKHRCLPLLENDEGGAKVLYLAMDDPSDLSALDEVGFRVERRIRPVLVAPSELDEALARHYHWDAAAGSFSNAPDDESWDEKDAERESFGLDLASSGTGSDSELEFDSLETAPPEALADSEPSDFGLSTGEPGSMAGQDAVPPVGNSVSQAAILRALTQLLVEKGIITREELVERLGAIAAGPRP